MGSKQTMVLAPLVVWLWDWMFGPEPDTADAGRARSAPAAKPDRLYVGLAATWLILAALVAYERWPTPSVQASTAGRHGPIC